MTLQKKILRSLKKNLSFYLTGSILTALCIMLWVGAFSVSRTVIGTYTRLFEQNDLEDGQFTVSSPISDEDINALESEFSVTLERQSFQNISYGGTVIRLFADTQKIDKAVILEGSPLRDDDEVLLTYNYAKAQGLSIGDTITLAGHDYVICGLCIRPEYAAMYANPEDSFPNSTDFGIALITPNAMNSIGGYSSYYSVKYIIPEREADFRAAIYSRYGTLEYIGKSANPRTGGLLSQADDLKSEFSVYSPIIMIVVVAVIAMVLGRTVRRESRTIGTLMALGYRRSKLMRHYLWYALIPAVFGDILGLALCYPFAKLFNMYMFSFAEHIEYQVQVPVGILIAALIIPPIAYGISALLVLCRALGQDIVPLLKGSTKGKTARMLSRSRLPFPILYGIRSLFGNISRSLTMIVGIAAASMAIILGGVYQDAYDDMLDNKVPMAMMGGQYEYGFTDFQSENTYGGYGIIDISFGVDGTDSMFNLVGYDEDCPLLNADTRSGEPMNYGGLYMTSSAARIFGVESGDEFTFYDLISMKHTTITISDIVENDVLSLIITSKANAAQISGRNADEFNVIISEQPLDVPPELLKKSASLEDYRRNTESALNTARIVLSIVKVIGALICILVVILLSGMIIEENRRSISTLEVLGYRSQEIRRLVLSPNHLLVPVGFVLGIPLGLALSDMIARANAASGGILMSITLTGKTLLISAVFIAAAYVISLALSARKLKKVDMVECLKEERE